MHAEPGSFRPANPFHMVWISTNACNARCLHCSSNSSCRTPDELSTTEAVDLMDQLADFGVVDLAVSGGEPLLRRDLFDVVAHARARGLAVGVGSNGARLSEKQAAALAELGVNRFQVSLDGMRDSHEALRRWPGLFDRVLKSIDVATAAGLRVHVCCTITRLNVDELETFTALVEALPVKRINFSRYVPTGRGTDTLDLSNDEWRSVVFRCAALKEEYAGRLEIVGHLAQQILVDEEVQAMPGYVGCQAGVGQGAVTADGTVLPCVLLPVPAGTIRTQRFADIWRSSPVLLALRDRDRLGSRCGNCAVRDRCGGCRAVAFAKTGSYLGDDPRCWLPAGMSGKVQIKRRRQHGSATG